MARFFVLGSLLVSTLAFASPRLFPQPSVVSLLTPELQLTEQKVSEPHVPTLVASGMFAALVASPIALGIGAGLGTLSNDLIGALLPALLTPLLVVPLAVVITEWMVAERSGKGRFRLIPTLLVAVLAQAGVMAAGIFLGVNATHGSGIAIMTLPSAVVLPTVTTAMLKVTERSPVVSVPVLSGNF